MVSRMLRFVLLWTGSATFALEGRSEQHELCRTLESGERQLQARYPCAYTCIGDGPGAVCTLQSAEDADQSAKKVNVREGDAEDGAITWWVYEGRHEHGLDSPEPRTADERIDCTDYIQSRHTSPASQKLRNLMEDDADVSSDAEDTNAKNNGGEKKASTKAWQPRTSLVHAPNATCDDFWLSWPAMQERAIASGTVVIFDVISSVGNLFLTLDTLMKFVRLLDLGLILTWNDFPGFREAFNPGEIDWNLDADLFVPQIGDKKGGQKTTATGLHSLQFHNFAMVLSDSQLELLALTLNISETNTGALADHFREKLPNRMNVFMSHVMRQTLAQNKALNTQPCTWNMLLSRSPSMIASLEEHSPWTKVIGTSGRHHQAVEYVAWHIRTADGETAHSYAPTVHKYVIQEPSSEVCPTYRGAMEDALQLVVNCGAPLSIDAGDELVYISSNSKPMAKDCTAEAASHDIAIGHVDMGLNSSDAHTAHSSNPLQTALGAFLDFFFLLDATVIVRTGSSFSGTVVKIKGMQCEKKVYKDMVQRIRALTHITEADADWEGLRPNDASRHGLLRIPAAAIVVDPTGGLPSSFRIDAYYGKGAPYFGEASFCPEGLYRSPKI